MSRSSSRARALGGGGRAAILLACAVSVGVGAQESPTRPPNVLLIVVDDLGWSDLPCYGNRFHETPNIDRFAAEGVRFTDSYAAAPVCSPTRASLLSGQHPARIGMTDFVPGHWRPFERLVVPDIRGELPLEVVTPAEAARSRGYSTAYFGKWHLGDGKAHPRHQGHDVAVVTSGRHFAPRFRADPPAEIPDGAYLADWLTDRAIEFLSASRDRPFILTLAHFAVHLPIEAKSDAVARYSRKPRPGAGVHNPTYAAMVEHVDESVGRLLGALDELGLAQSTLVILTSDNGGLRQTFTGRGEVVTTNAPLREEKGTLYEGGIRVPLIVRWPGVTPARAVCSEPVTSCDLFATIVAAVGAPTAVTQEIDGVDLTPLLRSPESRLPRDAIYFHYPHYHHARPASALRAGRWKLLENLDDGTLELYDLDEDIGEERSLSAKLPETAAALARRLADWRHRVGAAMPRPNPQHDPARAHEWWSRRTGSPLPSSREDARRR